MVIVGFDTSSALTSVAVVEGDRVIAERSELDARRHAEVMAPLLSEVLAESGITPDQVDAVACGVGPGPYTGLRVAIATARALGLAWDRPVYGLCSLDAMAAEAFATADVDRLCVAVDARRREVYWAAYARAEGRTTGPWVMRPSDIDDGHRALPWVGPAVEQAVELGIVLATYPQATWVARTVDALLATGAVASAPSFDLAEHGADGRGTAAALAGHVLLTPEPLYLRRPDAAVPVVRT